MSSSGRALGKGLNLGGHDLSKLWITPIVYCSVSVTGAKQAGCIDCALCQNCEKATQCSIH